MARHRIVHQNHGGDGHAAEHIEWTVKRFVMPGSLVGSMAVTVARTAERAKDTRFYAIWRNLRAVRI